MPQPVVLLRWAWGHEDVADSQRLLTASALAALVETLPAHLGQHLRPDDDRVADAGVAHALALEVGDEDLRAFFSVASFHGGFTVQVLP